MPMKMQRGPWRFTPARTLTPGCQACRFLRWHRPDRLSPRVVPSLTGQRTRRCDAWQCPGLFCGRNARRQLVRQPLRQSAGGAPAATTNSYGLQFSPVAIRWNTLTLSAPTTPRSADGAPGRAQRQDRWCRPRLGFHRAFTYEITSVSLVTNSTPPVAPSFPSLPNVPYPQTVYAGGGASFSFTEAGTLPFTNHWDFNQSGIFLTDGTTASGSIISGSDTTFLTIQNVSQADAGGYRGVVSNPGGMNNTGDANTTFPGPTPLTVNDPPLGLIYSESFPLYAVFGANQTHEHHWLDKPIRHSGSHLQNRSCHVGAWSGVMPMKDSPPTRSSMLRWKARPGFRDCPSSLSTRRTIPAAASGSRRVSLRATQPQSPLSASFAVQMAGTGMSTLHRSSRPMPWPVAMA